MVLALRGYPGLLEPLFFKHLQYVRIVAIAVTVVCLFVCLLNAAEQKKSHCLFVCLFVCL